MYVSRDKLLILDADGTTVDAFSAIDTTFSRHGMDIGDLVRFQKRRKLFKYLGGIRELPNNIRLQFGKQSRKRLLATLTEVYREEGVLYPGMAPFIKQLLNEPDLYLVLVTRNITHNPAETLSLLFARHDIDLRRFHKVICLPLSENKDLTFQNLRAQLGVNPALSYACGDEFSDYRAAMSAGMHPFMVSYGFEDMNRLTERFNIPRPLISATPDELASRVCHALGLNEPDQAASLPLRAG
ncbi:HAD hydrolase-like protein [Burkholderiaceae bacterium DAT-1]|nr:HAD hydrolase-like protein [Burkholderiaceae bacterium DAT-1]